MKLVIKTSNNKLIFATEFLIIAIISGSLFYWSFAILVNVWVTGNLIILPDTLKLNGFILFSLIFVLIMLISYKRN